MSEEQTLKDIKEGAIKNNLDHVWQSNLVRPQDRQGSKNPSVYRTSGFYVVISLYKPGELIVEAVSVHGDEGGRAVTSESKMELKYTDIVTIGDSKLPKPKMMRVCRNAGKLSLVFGKATTAGNVEASRTFTRLIKEVSLEPTTPFQNCSILQKSGFLLRMNLAEAQLMATHFMSQLSGVAGGPDALSRLLEALQMRER